MEKEIRAGVLKVHGTPENYTIGHIVENYAKNYPEKPYVYYGDEILTRKTADEHANQIARAFLDIGVKRGDRIGQMMYNSPEYMEIWNACWKIGAVSTTVNYRYTERELKYIVDNAQMSVLCLSEGLVDTVRRAKEELKSVKHFVVIGKKENVPDDMVSYEELFEKYPKTKPELPWREPNGDDLAVLQYTGGTTGMPKGVMWRHIDWIGILPTFLTDARFVGNLLEKLSKAPKDLLESMAGNVPIPFLDSILDMQLVRRLLLTPLLPAIGGRLIAELLPFLLVSSSTPLGPFVTNMPAYVLSPLMHGMGAATGELFSLLGLPIVLSTSESFDPVEVWENVEKRRVAVMSLVGDAFAKPMAEVLEREPGRYDISSLLGIGSVGHTFSPSVKKIFLKHIPGLLILDTLSATEAVSPAIQLNTSADEEIEYRSFKADRTNVRVVDPETYKDVKPGEMGILMVGGNQTIPIGYFGEEEKTAEVFKVIDGKRWNIFGDTCTIDEEGVIHFIGRGKLCINTGGEKVYTEEVEDIIKEIPKVETATVVGVPDERWGEAVSALVELKEGEKMIEEEIREACRDKLAGYKIPKHVIFGKVPLTAIGKVSFKEAKKITMDALGMKE